MVGFEKIISGTPNNIKREDLVRINIKQNKTEDGSLPLTREDKNNCLGGKLKLCAVYIGIFS